MKECGRMTRLTARENSYMLMAIFMRVNGSMIKPRELALTHMLMVPTMRVNGSMISSMDKE